MGGTGEPLFIGLEGGYVRHCHPRQSHAHQGRAGENWATSAG